MEQEFSAEELEVVEILEMLRRSGPPCTHNLRWGGKRKRSADGDESPAASLPPPLRQPAEPPRHPVEKLSRKRGRDVDVSVLKVPPSVGAAAQASGGPGMPPPSLPRPRKVARREGSRRGRQEQPPAAVVVRGPEGAAATVSAPETSSPGTPLEFCPSGDEPDAKAKPRARPRPTKKPRLKHKELSEQVDQLSRTRTVLQQEAAEIRNRLQALGEHNSRLTHLCKKLKEEADRRRQQPEAEEALRRTSCLDLLAMGAARLIPAAHSPDHVNPQLPQEQPPQHAWSHRWVNNPVVLRQLAPADFSIQPPPAENQHWKLVWRSDGVKGCAGASRLPDLNSIAENDPDVEAQQQPQLQQGYYYYDHHHQQQQQQQRRSSPEEQREARKKRIEMIHRRRNAAAAGGSIKVPAFR